MSAQGLPVPTQRPLVPSGLLGMAIFVATETMFFVGLISAFIVLRAEAIEWPPIDQPRLPVLVTGINTAILLLSGWTMHRALRAVRESREDLARWLTATGLLGAAFLAVQGSEWVRLIGYGLTTTSSLYGATFYTLVGVHALHVAVALVALLVTSARARQGAYDAGESTGLACCNVYWLFVVAVWPVLYLLVYFP